MIRLFGWHKQLPNISINSKTLIHRWLKTRRRQATIPVAAEWASESEGIPAKAKKNKKVAAICLVPFMQ